MKARGLWVLLSAAAVALAVGWGTDSALAGWSLGVWTKASIAYNNGITFDQARSDFFFDGVSSTTNSGLYRTNSELVQNAANTAVIPPTAEGYNHTGDLSFDPVRRRILLPLECYYPATGGNTCGSGAIGVADPVTLRFLYYINLSPAQIKKACEPSLAPTVAGSGPRAELTSSPTRWLTSIAETADLQRVGKVGGMAAGISAPSCPPAASRRRRSPRTHSRVLLACCCH
jgi:hypothetical protein